MEGDRTQEAIYDIVWDVEGPLIHPGFDFAKEILRENSSDITEKLGKIEINNRELTYFEAAFEVFDPYDDERWFYERTHNAEPKHSTGTTPVISLIICALMNWDDETMTGFAVDNFCETPGCRNMHRAIKEIGAREFLVSNSYTAQCLNVAKKKNIPFLDAYCMGYQLDDEKRKIKRELDEEVRIRSPLGLWRKHMGELKRFLDAYLQNAGKLKEVYEPGNDSGPEQIRILLSEQRSLFERIKNNDLKESLKYFLDKKGEILEEGVMGAYRKKQTLQKINEKRKKGILFISDSIVDVDALEYVRNEGLGITINCTQEECLRAAHVSMATLNWEYAEEIVKDIVTGKLRKSDVTQDILERYIREEDRPFIRVFSGDYISGHIKEVIEANQTVKDTLIRAL